MLLSSRWVVRRLMRRGLVSALMLSDDKRSWGVVREGYGGC